MTAPADRPGRERPGRDRLVGVRAVVLNVVEAALAEPASASPARVAHLRNALNCFPELCADVAARLRRAGRPDDVDRFVHGLAPADGAGPAVDVGWSALRSGEAVEAIVAAASGGVAGAVAPGDRLVLAASVLLLRRMLAEPVVPPDEDVPAEIRSALADLRRHLPPRPSPPGPPRPAVSLDDLLARRAGDPDPSAED